GLGRVCGLFQSLAAASLDWTTCALRTADRCVASKRSSWEDHCNTGAWRSASCLSAGRMTDGSNFCAVKPDHCNTRCLEASITLISGAHDVPDPFLRPTGRCGTCWGRCRPPSM